MGLRIEKGPVDDLQEGPERWCIRAGGPTPRPDQPWQPGRTSGFLWGARWRGASAPPKPWTQTGRWPLRQHLPLIQGNILIQTLIGFSFRKVLNFFLQGRLNSRFEGALLDKFSNLACQHFNTQIITQYIAYRIACTTTNENFYFFICWLVFQFITNLYSNRIFFPLNLFPFDSRNFIYYFLGHKNTIYIYRFRNVCKQSINFLHVGLIIYTYSRIYESYKSPRSLIYLLISFYFLQKQNLTVPLSLQRKHTFESKKMIDNCYYSSTYSSTYHRVYERCKAHDSKISTRQRLDQSNGALIWFRTSCGKAEPGKDLGFERIDEL